jgi:DNA helicase-2/ATP-dependent DNA helicase PcrA
MTFDELYKKLNKEQRDAVDSIEGPVMVVAGPGTGKTTVLTLRIAQILRKTDTPPGGILAITYTDAGVKAMREKLREVIGSRSHEVAIFTFHSFAAAMIAEYPDHFIAFKDSKQMTDVEKESLLRQIISDPAFATLRPMSRPDVYLSSISRAISEAKRDALGPDMVSQYALSEAQRIKEDESNISTRGATKGKLKAEALERLEKIDKTILLSDIYKKYEKEKQERKLRDYDDLIVEFLLALGRDELLLRLIQERFLYIMVDEHQDTNDAQNLIISMLAEFFRTPNIFIVGDEKQAIYRFQGASVENFLLLRKKWPDMKVIALDKNYRSHQDILDASFSMIENNYGDDDYLDLRVKLKSESTGESQPLDIIAAENTAAMEKYLVETVGRIGLDDPKANIAVITRRNRELERVLRIFEDYGLKASSERSVDIFHHPIGAMFFDLLRFLSDPTDVSSLSRTIVSGMWGISFGKSIEIIRSLKSDDLFEMERHLPAMKIIQQRMLNDGAVGAIIDIAEISGFTSIVSGQPSSVNVWKGIVALAESLAGDSSNDNPMELISKMLDYYKSAEEKTVKVPVGAPDLPIKVMTAHGSKGLEFDYVFIPYANEECWVDGSRGSSFVLPEKNYGSHDISDLRRLFYVALTRARKHAVILYSAEESDGRALRPLRFIDELSSSHVRHFPVKREDFPIKTASGSRLFSNEESGKILTEQAKRVLLENGLSVTALNHFLECPNKFLYESILKMPQAPSFSSEKGNAMHHALAKCWSLSDRSENEIEKTLVSASAEFLEKSFLPKNQKDEIKKEISENSPEISKALNAHFSSVGEVSVEKWAEIPFQNGEVIISLHGKLDAVIRNGDKVDVFDYKTRTAMSEAAIKGETKNSDGNYFRQLVFYNLLLEKEEKNGKKISTSIVFVSPDDKGRCPIVTLPVGENDKKRVREEISQLVESVWNGKIASSFCDDQNCRYCGLRR